MIVPIVVLIAPVGIILLTSLEVRSSLSQVSNSIPLSSDTIRVTGNITITSKDTDENWFLDPLKFLSHPFILILFGSTTSALFIALFTRQWEQKQKSLEIDRQQKQRDLELEHSLSFALDTYQDTLYYQK